MMADWQLGMLILMVDLVLCALWVLVGVLTSGSRDDWGE